MHELRPPTARDVPMLARLHVQGWEETYRGLLPPSEFDSHGLEVRLSQWSRQVAAGTSRIALAPGLGFAQMGPQRDRTEATAAYPDELYCLYVLREAHGTGLGAALLAAGAGRGRSLPWCWTRTPAPAPSTKNRAVSSWPPGQSGWARPRYPSASTASGVRPMDICSQKKPGAVLSAPRRD
jgi:hypothetical protein